MLATKLAELAPEAPPEAIRAALTARQCAGERGPRLALVDYSRSSLEPRLWVFDLSGPSLLFVEHVAHGRNSGGDMPAAFSNTEGSFQSSIGLFRTAETYEGGNGYSLRLDGLEPVNDRARERAIVMHGAPYVDPRTGRAQGRLGRSLGCPAVRPAIAKVLIDALSGGNTLFAWYPDPAWLASSPVLNCQAARTAGSGGTASATGANGQVAPP